MKEMRQIRQSHGARLQVLCLTHIIRYERDKGFCSKKVEDKMNKELRMEMENQVNLLETARAEMEALKGGKSTSGGSLKMVCFNCGMPGIHKGKKFFLWKDLS
jgi:hypothetical protein